MIKISELVIFTLMIIIAVFAPLNTTDLSDSNTSRKITTRTGQMIIELPSE